MAAGLSQEYDHTRQGSDKEDQKHWSIDDNDVTSVFLKYQLQADVNNAWLLYNDYLWSTTIPKPFPLESNIQEILALSDVFFLANEQHSECKMAVFGGNDYSKIW